MKLLLDTHTFVWWASYPNLLSARASALCHDPANTLLISVASAWEMQIKIQLGKMKLALPLAQIMADQQRYANAEVLPISLTHVLTLDQLPMHHKDPFDRILIAQAIVENAAIVSRDAVFNQYPVNVQW